jgi:hypothetical protein
MISDFKSLPKHQKVAMYYRNCAELVGKYLMMYYVFSYLRHSDSHTFLDKRGNLQNLRRFIGTQLTIFAPHLKLYSNYEIWEKEGFPLIGEMSMVEEYIKEFVAYYLWHILYAYPFLSAEKLKNHFKLGNAAWETVTTMAKNNKERYKNMKALDLTNVTATQGGEFPRVTPGGYVIGIVNVEDVPEKEYLKITYDIAEGDLKNYYYEMHQRTGYDLPCFYKSYKDKALGFFKAFLEAVEGSNAGYKWDNDERKLCRKFVGCVLREEEYRNRDGEIKVSLKPDAFYPAADIRAGKFDVPPKKTLSNAANAAPAAGYGANTANYTPAANAPLTSAQAAAEDMVIFSGDGVPF